MVMGTTLHISCHIQPRRDGPSDNGEASLCCKGQPSPKRLVGDSHMRDTASSSPSPTTTSSSHVCTPATPRNDEKMPTQRENANQNKNVPEGKHATDSALLTHPGRCQVGTRTLLGSAPNPGYHHPWFSRALRRVWSDIDLHRNLCWKQYPPNQPY